MSSPQSSLRFAGFPLSPRSAVVFGCVALFCSLVFSVRAMAAEDKKKKKEEDKPAREDITLTTKDRVSIKCTYYEGTEGKNTVPIVLLHGWGGRRGEYKALAGFLQEKGHAVIVPDLRGHGGSQVFKHAGTDREEELELDDFRAENIYQMSRFDIEAVKSFLLKENNEGNLNIELLCVVGADVGALAALNWAAQDWSWPQLSGYKQGQDVKALVLLSPVQSYKGAMTRLALNHPVIRDRLSYLLIAGKKKPKAYAEAKRVNNTLKKNRPPVPKDPKLRLKKQDLFFISLDTTLQGTKLLEQKTLKVDSKIASFVKLRLVDKLDDFPWTDRTGP